MKRLKIIFILNLIFCSCAAQNIDKKEEDRIYTLIDTYYNLTDITEPVEFLYYKTISISENSQFSWTSEKKLSEILKDEVFVKNCKILLEFLSPTQISHLDERFLGLKSITLQEDKLSAPVLNTNFLQKETYENVPDAANKKISYPIIVQGKDHIYGIFVEDAHNAGGTLYIYELRQDSWHLFCKDMLWVV